MLGDVAALPCVSVARTASDAVPSLCLVVFHANVYGVVVVASTTAPLTSSSTLPTASGDGAEAAAVTDVTPLTVEPSAGEAIFAVGWSSMTLKSSIATNPTAVIAIPTDTAVAPAGACTVNAACCQVALAANAG